jgi:hypothetical protein
MIFPPDLAAALAARRYETARRIGLEIIRHQEIPDPQTILLLHDVYVALADFHAARNLLIEHQLVFAEDRFSITLKLAGDLQILASETHYRLSDEAKQGFSIDEYTQKYQAQASEKFREAESLAITDEQKAAMDAANVRFNRKIIDSLPAEKSQPPAPSSGKSLLKGRISLPDGVPAANVSVTLGLAMKVHHADPATFYSHEMGYRPVIEPQEKLVTQTSETGEFCFNEVPAGENDFLAVTLNSEQWEIPTHFLARSLEIPSTGEVDLGHLIVSEWTSAPAAEFQVTHSDLLTDDNDSWRKVAEFPLRNPFHYDFPRQLLRLPLPRGIDPTLTSIRVVTQPGGIENHQIVGNEIAILTGLPAMSESVLAIYVSNRTEAPLPNPDERLKCLTEPSGTWLIDTGAASFRVAGNVPIVAVRRNGSDWRGNGRLVLPAGVSVVNQTTRVQESGPLLIELVIAYELSNGLTISWSLTAIAGEPYLLIHEISPELDGAAFEFSLSEFSGGRGFLHWTSEMGSWHWSTLNKEDAVIARLPESVPWWVPPQGFGYAMTPDGLAEPDYIAVFTLRRGEWIDRKFERITQGPIDEDGCENRELDWPYPEMVGSSISMITAHTDAAGDAFFRFGLFNGERRWGLLVSTLDKNDGPEKEIASIQHANSSPRLQDFKDWHLDVPDAIARPHVVVRRDQLLDLRKKRLTKPFDRIWHKIRGGRVPGPTQGLLFAIEGDPLIAWRKRAELLAVSGVYSKMTLLGRDRGDMFSPVGGRPITQWAEDYDLIAASGVFTADEERQVRAFLILMAHMYLEPDFMNWKFNGRNANFEADRSDIVGTIGLVFDGHPDSAKFLDHVIERTHKALSVYCTPGSGKWYENPACYYLHASKCRMNLVYHLASHGRIDVATVPRLKEFLRWGILLLTPPQPVSYQTMKDGDEAAFTAAEKVRKIPPIGDHACLGRWLPEHYAFIGKLFQASDPAFAKELIHAYLRASGDGQRLLPANNHHIDQEGEHLFHDGCQGTVFGNLPLFFAAIDAADIPENPTLNLASRKLEGFGAVLRSHVNTSREEYLLIKQGPGGYRYHRTEGSFLYFAQGRPLVYDGGEAGETWRHSTLSFFDAHTPLSTGRVERFFSTSAFQFVQGIHPEIIHPGQPVFLSDSCEHELVDECYRRFKKEPPAAVRSFVWIADEYLVVHDTLNLADSVPSHWHLQVIANEVEGNAAAGFRFKGRYGVDLAVHFPGQIFDTEKVERVPVLEYHSAPDEWFAMQHLQLGRKNADGYLALLKPLAQGEFTALQSTPLIISGRVAGISVETPDGKDLIWLSRDDARWSDGNIQFTGTYGAVLNRRDNQRFILVGTGEIRSASILLQSDGPSVILELTPDGTFLTAEGNGVVAGQIDEKPFSHDIAGNLRLRLSQQTSLALTR